MSPTNRTFSEASGGRVIPDKKFDLPSLRAMDANVVIGIGTFDSGTDILEPLNRIGDEDHSAEWRRALGQYFAIVLDGKVISDPNELRWLASIAGVKKVVAVDGNAVAVVADTWWQANQALKALNIAWEQGPNDKVSGETIVRNLEAGTRRAEELGGSMAVGYLPDMFGHVAQMPQILRQGGVERAVVGRGFRTLFDVFLDRWQRRHQMCFTTSGMS